MEAVAAAPIVNLTVLLERLQASEGVTRSDVLRLHDAALQLRRLADMLDNAAGTLLETNAGITELREVLAGVPYRVPGE